jgi:hypothetical protein
MRTTKLYGAIDLHSNNLLWRSSMPRAGALSRLDYFASSTRSRNSLVRIDSDDFCHEVFQ